MKNFLKMVLAVVCGVLLVSIITVILSAGIIGALAGAGKAVAPIPAEGVLKIDMSRIQLAEQTLEQDPFAALQGTNVSTIGILDAVKAIDAACDDPAVKYIYLKSDGGASSVASIKDLRDALAKFRARSGKAVVAYNEYPGTGSYYLASVADKVYLCEHPGANYSFLGVNMQTVFIKDLLDKLGVNIQLIRHGKYKSAGEMFVRNEASPENREQYMALVNSMWNTLRGEICASRGIPEDKLDSLVDNLELCLPRDFLDNGLVDELLNRSALEAKLATLAMKDDFDDVPFIKFPDYVAARSATVAKAHKKKIAVIYADGEIVDGSDLKQMAGDRFASVIEDVRRDRDVQAVVLRVNSPGGSVVASEKIKSELDLIKGTMPLVASYGDYAASGGYWISNNCDHIFCNPLCLTGSIGVFGMVPDFSKTYKDVLHVNFSTFSSNRHGDMFALARPLDTAEHAYMQRSIEQIYDRFTTIVSDGRGIEKERVDEIGQGRVWSGADALEISLVDEMGNLQDAIAWAADAAGDPDLANWTVEAFPKPLTAIEQVVASLTGKGEDDFSVLERKIKECKSAQIEARLPFEMMLQ